MDEFQTLQITVNGTGQVETLTKALDAEAKAVDRAAVATAKASKSKQQLGRDAMEASRALQDFAQGGLGGVLNNLEALGRIASRVMPRVTAFFGGPAGLAAAATTVGVAIYALQDPVKALVGWLTSEGNGIPKATDAVGKLDARLKDVKDRLGELEKGWDGSARSVAEYNRLTGEQVGLEKKLAAAKKERAAIDAQREKEAKRDDKVVSAASDAVKAAGGVDKVASDLAGAMPGATNAAQAQLDQIRRERDAAVKAAGSNMQARAGAGNRFAPQIAAAEETVRKAQADARSGAEGVLARALQGDPEALRQLARALPGRGFDQVGATAAMPGTVAGILGGVGKGAWEEQFRGGRMAQDADMSRRAVAATAAGMLGGFNAGAAVENRQGGAVARALAPFRKDEAQADAEAFDRGMRGGFSQDESDAVTGGQGVVNRARSDFGSFGRVDRVSSNEVDKALAEAQGALNMQMTSEAPDMRVMEMLSSLASQLIQVKQQLANQAQQSQALHARQSNLMGGGGAPMEPMLWGSF